MELLRVPGSGFDLGGADARQERKPMLDLVVLSFGVAGFRRALQGRFKVIFGNSLDVSWRAGKVFARESIAIELGKCLAVGQEPRFHSLNHEEDLVII